MISAFECRQKIALKLVCNLISMEIIIMHHCGLSDNATDIITNADILEYLAFYMFIQGETSSVWRDGQLVFFYH